MFARVFYGISLNLRKLVPFHSITLVKLTHTWIIFEKLKIIHIFLSLVYILKLLVKERKVIVERKKNEKNTYTYFHIYL